MIIRCFSLLTGIPWASCQPPGAVQPRLGLDSATRVRDDASLLIKRNALLHPNALGCDSIRTNFQIILTCHSQEFLPAALGTIGFSSKNFMLIMPIFYQRVLADLNTKTVKIPMKKFPPLMAAGILGPDLVSCATKHLLNFTLPGKKVGIESRP